MATAPVRIQQKGQVTIPAEIRKKLKLKKGDLVTFIETGDAIVILPAEVIVSVGLDEIGRALKAKGLTLDKLTERGREIRADLIKDEYGLSE